MAKIDQLFRYMKEQGGYALQPAAGLATRIRKHGELEAVANWPVFTDSSLRDLLREMATESQWAHYQRTLDLDFAYALEGIGRFRANFLTQENGAGGGFPSIPGKITTLEELHVPTA